MSIRCGNEKERLQEKARTSRLRNIFPFIKTIDGVNVSLLSCLVCQSSSKSFLFPVHKLSFGFNANLSNIVSGVVVFFSSFDIYLLVKHQHLPAICFRDKSWRCENKRKTTRAYPESARLKRWDSIEKCRQTSFPTWNDMLRHKF